MIKHKMLYLE